MYVIRPSSAIHLSIACFTCVATISGINPVDFESDWIWMKSEDGDNSSLTVKHGLRQVPLKVKVLVKPVRGPYKDWIFEAGGSQQTDDDYNWLYCGILFVYNAKSVLVFAPINNLGNGTAMAFCIDSSSWFSGSNLAPEYQVESEVLVKVLAWKKSGFPPPSFQTDWIAIKAQEAPDFLEIAHDLGDDPSLVHLQMKCELIGTQIYYADGVGAGFKGKRETGKMRVTICGLVFGYNDTHVRIWSPTRASRGRIICIGDGYSLNRKCMDGYFRLTGWTSIGDVPERFAFHLNESNNGTIPDMSALKMNLKRWDPLNSFITVQVKALDGPNEGFVFPAAGQIYRNDYPDLSYGGVIFAYSPDSLRIFVPSAVTGTLIHISEHWGSPNYTQMSNNAAIIVKIWNNGSSKVCLGAIFKGTSYYRPSHIDCLGHIIRCTALCMLQPECMAVSSCSVDSKCEFLDVGAVNNKIIDGTFRMEVDALIETLTCY